ncbi:hypothetical protein Droror1_Dr00024747 [Drosera rotundifolia]
MIISFATTPFPLHHHSLPRRRISAAAFSSSHQTPPPYRPIIPTSTTPTPQNLYQPFRPPPSPLPPQFRGLDVAARLDILTNRMGLWYEYGPLVNTLFADGFTPSTLEEITGISGVEQNQLIVGSQVHQSLKETLDPETLSYYDKGGAEILYEIRLLNAVQRTAAAIYLVENNLDARGAREVARAMKDFPSRKIEPGWESFDGSIPQDCLSFMYLRQSIEHKDLSPLKRRAALETALECAVSENAKKRVLEELEGKRDKTSGDDLVAIAAKVPVVRLHMGEVAESTSVVVLPVCKAEEREEGILRAPLECRTEGDFGIIVSDKGWNRWVVLPGWEPLAGVGRGGVVVELKDAKALPWRAKREYKQEPILVVADRGRKEVTSNDGFYLVVKEKKGGDDGRSGELKVERGFVLKETGVTVSLGTVVLVVRPPKYEDDGQLNEDDWD